VESDLSLQHFVADDGEHIHLQVIGEPGAGKSPLVFLHGWTSSHAEWLPYASELADTHVCYCWDARGHGGHPLRAGESPSVQRMARDVMNLIEHFALEQPALLGHSMGALTTWEHIRQFGDAHLSKLVLIDQSPRLMTDDDWRHGIYSDFSADRNCDFIARLEDDFAETVLRLAADGKNARATQNYASNSRGFQRVREYLQGLEPEPLIEIWKTLTLADYRELLPEIHTPTLLLHGDQSHFYSVELAEWVRDAMPKAELHIYEGTDHSPHLWQRERFLDDLRRFTATD
jgi:pimeloyl-ACP methyl ester carboxylesterase